MSAQGPYPALEPFDRGFLKVSDIHTVYYEQSGNPDGAPVVFLHGGPGAGSSPKHRQFFDPAHYRIVIFDQRGAGKSTPHAELAENSTQHLTGDIEKLRTRLGIGKWHVLGGSWGSTLALAYAIAHPSHVASLVLRGIFMMRRQEIDWFLHGMRSIFPEEWKNFTSHFSETEKADILQSYYTRLTSEDYNTRLAAAQRWAAYETACCALLPKASSIEESKNPAYALSIARIEAHYFHVNKFNPDNYLLANIHRIRHIPGIIVQGRYDIICPAQSAFELHEAWPESELVMVPDAGHSAFEPGILAQLIAATNKFRAIKI